MVLDFSEAAGYYGLFSFIPVFVLTKGVVDVSAGTVPYYHVIANVGALAGGLLVSWALDRAGRKPTLFGGYTAAAASSFMVAAAATTGSPGLTLAAFTAAVFFATTAWVSAYPTFTELFPTTCERAGSAPASPSDGSARSSGRSCLRRPRRSTESGAHS